VDFIAKQPRERAGSTASSRFDYQKDISICMLLEYHEKGNDYLFVFDYHDDLVVLDSEVSPTKYNFFQIKAKETGYWQLNALVKPKKGKADAVLPSILGKMHDHLQNFPTATESLTFLSNTKLSVKLKGLKTPKQYEQVNLGKLGNDTCRIVQTALEKELAPGKLLANFFNITFFASHALSVNDSSTHTKGKLSEFLNKRTQGKKYNVESVYKNILDEVKRKSNDSSVISDFAQLKERKGIGRSTLEEVLLLIGARKDYEQIWQTVHSDLKAEGVGASDIFQFKDLWNKLEIDRMDPTNRTLQQAIKETRQSIDNLKSTGQFSGQKVMDLLAMVVAQISGKDYLTKLTHPYVQTIILAHLYE